MVRAGEFVGWAPTLLVGKRVQGASLGLVGMGRIGQAMARQARGFGLLRRLRAAAAPADPWARTRSGGDLEIAIGRALHLVGGSFPLHCFRSRTDARPRDPRRAPASMRKGSILVNTARGACVDEEALADAVETGPLAAAALDVFERVPIGQPRLLALPNVVLAPHIGSAGPDHRRALTTMAIDNALAVLEGAEAAMSRVA